MKAWKIALTVLLIQAILASGAKATSDSASVRSRYFNNMSDGTPTDQGKFYAERWLRWLKKYRAIEANPNLSAQILRLPPDPYEGRKGARALIQRTLKPKNYERQSSRVFILQLGVYGSHRSLSRFVKSYWPTLVKKDIYNRISKDFIAGVSSESVGKTEPLFSIESRLKGRRVYRLCYGIYASTKDAERDAAAMKKIISHSPLVISRDLTPSLIQNLLQGSIGDYTAEQLWEWSAREN